MFPFKDSLTDFLPRKSVGRDFRPEQRRVCLESIVKEWRSSEAKGLVRMKEGGEVEMGEPVVGVVRTAVTQRPTQQRPLWGGDEES